MSPELTENSPVSGEGAGQSLPAFEPAKGTLGDKSVSSGTRSDEDGSEGGRGGARPNSAIHGQGLGGNPSGNPVPGALLMNFQSEDDISHVLPFHSIGTEEVKE